MEIDDAVVRLFRWTLTHNSPFIVSFKGKIVAYCGPSDFQLLTFDPPLEATPHLVRAMCAGTYSEPVLPL
jgi:hypothetical protein